ncbi:hypothetical protein PIB30_022565 [Stylosanthes scabra]|uniref:Putative plant transposon protein domain-containing protein n=1 Tax=Stylosanthes scabra TaxID=79078 RepID=A0ABU6Y990_9FABA|nr:hypothetical protein [Stylosanthes scabra]
MARPHASPARAKASARPRDELYHIRPKLYKCVMSRRKQAATDEATSSRVRTLRNSNRGRQDAFPNERFDHQIHFDRWKGMENRGIVHEHIVHIDEDEELAFRNRIQGLGWRFIYDDLVHINLSMVREFCANFSSATQNHVYLRGKKIPFTEAHIHGYLGIPGDAPDADIDDAFIALAKAYGRGEDVNIDAIYAEIGRPETNWADNPAVNTILNKINNSVLNSKAAAWHKIIMANIDPKTHGTKFDPKHAFLIYVLMTVGDVNLPRLMRDILLDHPADQPPQPETSAAPSAPAQYSLEPTVHDITRRFDRQDRQIARTQAMIRRAFLQTNFFGLGFSSSSDDSESQDS